MEKWGEIIKVNKAFLCLFILLSIVAFSFKETGYKANIQRVIDGDTIHFENEEKTIEKNKGLYDERQEEIPSQQQKHESNNWLLWIGVISGFAVAICTLILAIATIKLVGQNKIQMEYIQREHSLKNILEHIYAEIDQNLNIHEQIFNKVRIIYRINNFKELSGVKWTSQPGIIDISAFDTTVWDGAKLKIIVNDLNKLTIDNSPERIKELFKEGYPFNIAEYDIDKLQECESFYNRLAATYSLIKIQNEIVFSLRYATSASPADLEGKLKNYYSPLNFIELLNDLVRAKSYLIQALEKL